MDIKALIRSLPDTPKPGVVFRDITTLLKDGPAFRFTVEQLIHQMQALPIDKVVGIEARGFILGGAIAYELGLGFVPIRKKGKLPWKTKEVEYLLEYGSDCMEVHLDAVHPGEKIIIVDDLLATGGTAQAATRLVQQSEAEILGCHFVIDLPNLGGRAKLQQQGFVVHSLVEFEEE